MSIIGLKMRLHSHNGQLRYLQAQRRATKATVASYTYRISSKFDHSHIFGPLYYMNITLIEIYHVGGIVVQTHEAIGTERLDKAYTILAVTQSGSLIDDPITASWNRELQLYPTTCTATGSLTRW